MPTEYRVVIHSSGIYVEYREKGTEATWKYVQSREWDDWDNEYCYTNKYFFTVWGAKRWIRKQVKKAEREVKLTDMNAHNEQSSVVEKVVEEMREFYDAEMAPDDDVLKSWIDRLAAQPAAAQEAVGYVAREPQIGNAERKIGVLISDVEEGELLYAAPVTAAPAYIAVRVEGIGTAHLPLVDGGVDIPAMTVQHMAKHLMEG